MTEFKEIYAHENLENLSALAREIWSECYMPLLGEAQIAYMLKNIQSESPMRHQMEQEKYRYFFLQWNGKTAGYLGVQVKNNALFLSKLYLRKSARGHGIARDVMAFLDGWARGARLDKIWLTVNRGNHHAISVYQKLNFVNKGELDSDIGEGYIMDDYVFEKTIK